MASLVQAELVAGDAARFHEILQGLLLKRIRVVARHPTNALADLLGQRGNVAAHARRVRTALILGALCVIESMALVLLTSLPQLVVPVVPSSWL